MDPQWKMFRVFADVYFHSNSASGYMRNRLDGLPREKAVQALHRGKTPLRGKCFVWGRFVGLGRTRLLAWHPEGVVSPWPCDCNTLLRTHARRNPPLKRALETLE